MQRRETQCNAVLPSPAVRYSQGASMSKPEEITCANCRYFATPKANSRTECRRFAPVTSDDGGGAFPFVGSEDWCGEFQPLRPPVPIDLESLRAIHEPQGRGGARYCDHCDSSDDVMRCIRELERLRRILAGGVA